MQNDFIKERKDFIITIHTITPVGKQYKDSAYVHVSDLSLTVIIIYKYQVKFKIL